MSAAPKLKPKHVDLDKRARCATDTIEDNEAHQPPFCRAIIAFLRAREASLFTGQGQQNFKYNCSLLN